MKIAIRLPKQLKAIPKILDKISSFNWSIFKSATAIVIYGVTICVIITYILIRFLSNKDENLLAYRKFYEEYEKQQEEMEKLNEQLSNLQQTPKAMILDANSTSKAVYDIEIVNTDETRATGLSGRDSLKANEAMLFEFDSPVSNGFWMKDMKFALDIIFIDENYKIVEIAKNQQPCESEDTCPYYIPQTSYKYAIETNGGDTDTYQIQVGDSVNITTK